MTNKQTMRSNLRLARLLRDLGEKKQAKHHAKLAMRAYMEGAKK